MAPVCAGVELPYSCPPVLEVVTPGARAEDGPRQPRSSSGDGLCTTASGVTCVHTAAAAAAQASALDTACMQWVQSPGGSNSWGRTSGLHQSAAPQQHSQLVCQAGEQPDMLAKRGGFMCMHACTDGITDGKP